MDFKNDELGASFSVPDKLTVRQVLRYDEAVELSRGSDLYERLWLGACELAQEWTCETVALDRDALDGEFADASALSVIKWAGLQVFSFVQSLKAIPKNS